LALNWPREVGIWEASGRGPGDSSRQPVRGSSVVCSARTPRPGRYATLHLEDANRGRPLERKLLFRLRPNSRTGRRAAVRSHLGSAHGITDPVQETAVPFVLPQAVCVHGAIGSSGWILQARRRRCPRFHDAHLVPVAGDQVVGVADCRGGFKRNRQCPEVTEEFRAGGAGGGRERHGDIGPESASGALRGDPPADPGTRLDPGGRLWSDWLTACPDCSRHQ
jgi:hypothetical protein